LKEELCCTSKDVIQAATKSSGKSLKDFEVDSNVIIIFSEYLLNYLKKKTKLAEKDWLMPFHPYAAPEHIYRGSYKEINITVIIPPMGASPMASIAEDLIFCGAKRILLVCGSWGIGDKVNLLDYLIPTYALGVDGTTLHYGRNQGEETELDKEVTDTFIEEIKKKTQNYHIGKNFCKEAFYQIKKEEIYELQKKGCISIENGELNVLSTICNQNDVKFGAIFYSYYNPLDGWIIPWMEERYKDCVSLECEIALATMLRLNKL